LHGVRRRVLLFHRPYPGTLIYTAKGQRISLQLAGSLLVGDGFAPEFRGVMDSREGGTRIRGRIGVPRRTVIAVVAGLGAWSSTGLLFAWRDTRSMGALAAFAAFVAVAVVAFKSWIQFLYRSRQEETPKLEKSIEACFSANRVA
jgi:hypothetical protein